MKLILLGPPGAGKGTQAKLICEKVGIPAISTGNILRQAIKDETDTGILAKKYIDDGKLVPDDVILGIIRERLSEKDCDNGYLLDGFPRTIPQAEALDKMVTIDSVVSIEVPDLAIVNRMSKRFVCEKCGASYHLEHRKPETDGICDDCKGKLARRKDDEPETVKERLAVYHNQTEPLKDYYRKDGRLLSVDGQKSVEEVFSSISVALGWKL